MEKRMYFFVPYNISEIQKGIQAGHAAIEYARRFGDTELFKDFAENWKTFIILNGGTTNNNLDRPGTLQQTYTQILDFNIVGIVGKENIDTAVFQEPDLNDAITAICFIADERVFNYEDYPEFKDWMREIPNSELSQKEYVDKKEIRYMSIEEQIATFPVRYEQWVDEVMGGKKNEVLRGLIRGKKLA